MAVSGAQIQAVITIQGVDKAKSDLNDTGKAADQTQKSFGDMMKQGLANAASFAIFNVGAKAVNFLGSQLSSTLTIAMQHQDVMTQTAQVIKSTGDASGMTARQIGDLALSLSKTTDFSDDTTQAAENMLLTFTNIGSSVFPSATKTALDMSQALKEGPTQASMQLGKALNDPIKGITALQRVGVSFTDSQKQMITQMVNAGDVAGAQKIILGELSKEFGGSAEAAGKTFGGQLQILKNNLQDVKQQIGTALLPILGQMLSTVTGAVMPVLQNFGNWFTGTAVPAIQNFGATIGRIFNSLPVQVLLSSLQALGTQLGNLFGTIGSVASMIMGQFSGAFGGAGKQIKDLASGALFTLDDILIQVGYKIRDFSTFLNQFDFGEIISGIKQFVASLQPTAAILAGQFKTDLTWLGNTFNQIGGWIKSSLMPALATLVPPFMSIANTIATQVLPAAAELYATGHQLVESILTPLIGVLEQVIPPIISIAGWLLGGLAAGFQFVAPLVKGLADVISNLVNFFTKTELGGDLVKATLIALAIPVGALAIAFIALAVEAVAGFIMSIPAMVSGFLAGAAGAWSMAAGVIAATWPILAIIAVIALVILAIQHWGQIVDWLKTAWNAIATFFTALWAKILSGLQAAWNAIVNVVKIALGVLVAIIFGPIIAIAALFIWLYNHNTYFKMLVDAIVNFFKGCFDWLVGQWNNFIGWIGGVWQGLVGFASALWAQISGAIRIGFYAAIAYVTAIWNYISSVFSSAWNTYISKPLTTMWTNVSTFFSGIWTNYIAGPIGNLWNQLTTAIGGWAGKAVDWGKNLIKGFVNGIIASANSVAGAVGGIAGKVLAFLGFHSPTKEGPGQEADQWAPNFVKMFASGLEAGIPQIQSIVNQLAKPIAMSMNPISNPGLTAIPAGVSGIPSSLSSSANSGNQEIHVHNYIDGKEITNNAANRIVKGTRISGPIRSSLT